MSLKTSTVSHLGPLKGRAGTNDTWIYHIQGQPDNHFKLTFVISAFDPTSKQAKRRRPGIIRSCRLRNGLFYLKKMNTIETHNLDKLLKVYPQSNVSCCDQSRIKHPSLTKQNQVLTISKCDSNKFYWWNIKTFSFFHYFSTIGK